MIPSTYDQSLPMAAAHEIKLKVHRRSVEPKATNLGFNCHIWVQNTANICG